jgi:hypothetical protein
MLPRVKIFFENGALGKVVTPADGVLGLLCTGATVSNTFALATPYIVRNLDMVAALGITASNNPSIFKIASEYYAEAGNGAELWIMAFADTVKISDMVDVADAAKGKALINAANGRLRGLIVSRKPAGGYTPTITNGLDADVALALTKASVLADWARESKYAPVFIAIEGYAYSGNPVALADLKTNTKNTISILIGDTVVSSKQAAVGVLAGRIASIPVQRNIGRVKDGPVKAPEIYIYDKPAEQADVESIHNKGYITFRTFIGRSGYFFSDDPTATADTDDYSSLTARRTIDKAYRIAYDTMLEELLDEVPVTSTGTLQLPIVKSWEAKVENAIASGMTANGELSADVTDANDRGVKCYIDPDQNIISNSILDVNIRVRPFGYPRYINVYLGFQVISA